MDQEKEEKVATPHYGTLIIGPSGSGKTTLCHGLNQFFKAIKRKHVIVNLDPANENIFYECAIDIKELIQISDVMEELKLGPNGALIYAFEFLNENINWLQDKLEEYKEHYFVFDMPGQIELYINSPHMKNILETIMKNKDFPMSLTSVALFDSFFCYDTSNFISACLSALNIMINLETPHINVLSKIDLMKEYGKLPNRLMLYLEALDLDYISNDVKTGAETAFQKKFESLYKDISQMIENYGIGGFYPLRVTDKVSVCNLVGLIDKSNGYFFNLEYQKEKFSDIRQVVFDFKEIFTGEFYANLEEELGQEAEDSDIDEDMAKINEMF